MTVKRNDAARRCEIWIDYGEQDTYAASGEYRETVRRYRAMGWRVCVFLAGSEPMLPGAAALFERQQAGLI